MAFELHRVTVSPLTVAHFIGNSLLVFLTASQGDLPAGSQDYPSQSAASWSNATDSIMIMIGLGNQPELQITNPTYKCI